MARIISDQKWLAVQRRAVPPRQAPVRAPRIGVKNIEGRIRNRTVKIKKKLLAQPNVKVEKNGRDVRRMTVRRSAIYLAEVRTRRY